MTLAGLGITLSLLGIAVALFSIITFPRPRDLEPRRIVFGPEVHVPPSLPGCPHLRAPEPVTGLDGDPVGRWLCPTCLDEVPPPRPTVLPPACSCPPGEECEVVPLRLLDGTVVRYTRPCGGLLPAAPPIPTRTYPR